MFTHEFSHRCHDSPVRARYRGYFSIVPGEEYQYWRWASALSLAVSTGHAAAKGALQGMSGQEEEPGSLRGVVKELKASYPGGTGEKSADAVCTLRAGTGKVGREQGLGRSGLSL